MTHVDDPALYPPEGMERQCSFIVWWQQCRLDAGHDGLHSPGRLPARTADAPLDVYDLLSQVHVHIHGDRCDMCRARLSKADNSA